MIRKFQLRFVVAGCLAGWFAMTGCVRNSQVFAYVGRGVVVVAKDSKTLSTVIGSGLAAGGLTAVAFEWGEQKKISEAQARALIPDWNGKNSAVYYNPEAIQLAFNPAVETQAGTMAADLLTDAPPTTSLGAVQLKTRSFKVSADRLLKVGVIIMDTAVQVKKPVLSKEVLARYNIGVAKPVTTPDTLRLKPLIRIGDKNYRLGTPVTKLDLEKLNAPAAAISSNTFKKVWDAILSTNK